MVSQNGKKEDEEFQGMNETKGNTWWKLWCTIKLTSFFFFFSYLFFFSLLFLNIELFRTIKPGKKLFTQIFKKKNHIKIEIRKKRGEKYKLKIYDYGFHKMPKDIRFKIFNPQ